MSNLVAISATCASFHGAERVRLSANYVRSLEGAGLVPVVIPPLTNPSAAEEILGVVGGLLLTGGEDVDPARYGAPPHPALGETNAARDATEVALLTAARARSVPVLAICRGIQILNVALGGTLVQDLATERPSGVRHDLPHDLPHDTPHDLQHDHAERTHDVTIAADSKLAAATGTASMAVNSYHHQAVDRLGRGLRVTATSSDGVIEGAEMEDPAWWVLAVQWHPEDLTSDARAWDRGIFRAFADEIRRRRE
jgi:putative glutamine amidotransferase